MTFGIRHLSFAIRNLSRSYAFGFWGRGPASRATRNPPAFGGLHRLRRLNNPTDSRLKAVTCIKPITHICVPCIMIITVLALGSHTPAPIRRSSACSSTNCVTPTILGNGSGCRRAVLHAELGRWSPSFPAQRRRSLRRRPAWRGGSADRALRPRCLEGLYPDTPGRYDEPTSASWMSLFSGSRRLSRS